jgi:hypothetical protein
MESDIPADLPETEDWFCVDNIAPQPGRAWSFTDVINGRTHSYAPDFGGQPNLADNVPDAPPLCFDLVQPCYKSPKGVAIVYDFSPTERQAALSEFDERQVGVVYGRDTAYITPELRFDGDTCELRGAGLRLDSYIGEYKEADVTIPLEFLPRVSLMKGVREIRVDGLVTLPYYRPTGPGRWPIQ